MGAIPTSDMPGFKRLHERVCSALGRCQEGQGIDFKESAPWNDLKWRIIKTVIGMSNLRDGGVIIIGASEREQSWDLSGISQEHLATYDVDVIVDIINTYASPTVDIDVVRVKYSNNKEFLTIYAKEFNDTPTVCKKNSSDNKDLVVGGIYVRPPGVAKTTKVVDAGQIHELLELAAEKRARRILEVSHRVGLKTYVSSDEQFNKELDGL